MTKFVLAIVISLYAVAKVSAQTTATTFSKKFESHQSIWPTTKLHLIFNQDKFSPGDTAYFKAYFLKEDLNGVGGKQVINFNLVDSNGDSKLHFVFSVINGVGQNQFTIPITLPAGIYLVTAYSSWMKNFNPVPLFKKEIIIVKKNTILSEEKPPVKAVVEGGHLIGGVNNRIVVCTPRDGSIVKIINGLGQEASQTTTDRSGVGSIVFRPTKNTSYYVQVAEDSLKIPLPVVENDGCSLLLTPAKNEEDSIKINITSPLGSILRNEELFILVSSRGKIYHTASFIQGEKDFIEFQISQRNMPEGIAQISLLAHDGKLLASRDFYSSNGGAPEAKIQIKKKYFQAREKVSLEISLSDNEGHPLEGEFWIKVINAELFDPEKQNSLSDELTILSGLGGKYLIDRSDSDWRFNLDNYLISETKAIRWKEILSDNGIRPRFTFSNFIQKSGKVYNAETHNPVPDFTDIMFFLQRSKIRYQTAVENGKVWLPISDLYGQDELFYFGETFYYLGGVKHGEAIPYLKIEWDDESIPLPHSSASRETENPDRYASFVTKRRMMVRSYGFYTSSSGNSVDNTNAKGIDFETEVNGADITINVQNYMVFPSMTELVKEVIPSLQHRKSKGKDIVLVSLFESMSSIATGDPLYIIDGIATKSTDFFLSLKPADLLTLKIISNPDKLLRLGLLGKNGIVIVDTKNGDAREPLDDSSKLIEGLNKPLKFNVPDYLNDQNLHYPDFRSTIYWNPLIKTDQNGKANVEFFSSDDIGKLNIRIDGMTVGRTPFSASQDIAVSLSSKKN
jgi:hypothetical protein